MIKFTQENLPQLSEQFYLAAAKLNGSDKRYPLWVASIVVDRNGNKLTYDSGRKNGRIRDFKLVEQLAEVQSFRSTNPSIQISSLTLASRIAGQASGDIDYLAKRQKPTYPDEDFEQVTGQFSDITGRLIRDLRPVIKDNLRRHEALKHLVGAAAILRPDLISLPAASTTATTASP